MFNNTQKFLLITLGVLICLGSGLYIILLGLKNNYKYDTPNEYSYDSYIETSDKGMSGGGMEEVPSTDTQKLIKKADLNITVNDFDKTINDIKTLVDLNKGTVVYLNDHGQIKERNVNIKIKVPSNTFDSTISELKSYAVLVISSSENSSDVTMEYLDLQARLNTNKELEKTYLNILNKASKVSEILEIQRELSSVRTQIEYLESQIKYYDSQIDMSEINISLKLNSESLSIVQDDWKPFGVFKEALQALVVALQSLVNTTIWLIVFSPFIIIPIVIYKVITKIKKK